MDQKKNKKEKRTTRNRSSLSRINPKLKEKPIFIKIPIQEDIFNEPETVDFPLLEKGDGNRGNDIFSSFDKKPLPDEKPILFKQDNPKKLTNKEVQRMIENLKKNRKISKVDKPSNLFKPVYIPKKSYSSDITIKDKENPQNNTICSQVQPLLNDTLVSDSNDCYSPETCKDIACWWCCHTFNTIPVPIPIHYNKKTNQFKVYGVTCSFNCAKSYIRTFGTPGCSGGSNGDCIGTKSGRESPYLLSLLYAKMTGEKIQFIKEAPSNKILEMFGGSFSIEKFRENFKTPEKISIIPVPFIPTLVQQVTYPTYYTNCMKPPDIEENNEIKEDEEGEFFIKKQDLSKKKYRLQRTKPLPNEKNTLKNFL